MHISLHIVCYVGMQSSNGNRNRKRLPIIILHRNSTIETLDLHQRRCIADEDTKV